jgi:hypothetical protein
VTRDAWNRIGQFDEGFKLYYEETDWLIRLERHGLQPYHVPEAEAIHFYNQSAAGEPEAAAWYAESTKRFQGRYYGIAATNFLNWLPQGGSTTCAGASRLAGGLSEINAGVTRAISPACRWIEISPLMSGFPAAAAQVGPGNRWQLPADLWEHMAPGRYSLRALNDEETELHHFVFDVTVDARGMVHGGRGHA